MFIADDLFVFLFSGWERETRVVFSIVKNWSRPFQNVHPTGREKNGKWCSSSSRRKERNTVVRLSKSAPPRTSPRFGYRTVRLVCGRFHCDNIKRERERDVREILLGNNEERGKATEKKEHFARRVLMCRGDHDANEKSAKDNDIQA